jgi:hypothetical protein
MGNKGRSRRRYHPIGTEPIYDDRFDRLRVESVILNRNARANSQRYAAMNLNDPQVCELLRLEWVGGEQGEYLKNNTIVIARIPACEQALRENTQKFKRYRQQKVNEGNPVPDETPELHKERMELEAWHDVLQEEEEEIERWLERVKEPVQAADDAQVLRRGPVGEG